MHPLGQRRFRRVVVAVGLTLVAAVAAGIVLHERRAGSSFSPAAVQLDELEADGPCDAGRWPIKTLTDARASGVRLTPVPTTISALGALPIPTPAPTDDMPRLGSELQVETVPATLYVDHLEADLDIHLVLHDPAKPGATMISELPDPRCTTKADPTFQALMTRARTAYVQACGPASGDQGDYYLDASAQVTGVRFFDTIVGQFGRAPNAIELHPVLGFKILGPCKKMGGNTRFDLASSIDEGSTLNGVVPWTATVDPGSAKVTSLEFLVDGSRIGSLQSGNHGSVSVNTAKLVDGAHGFGVRATIADGSTTLLINHVQTRNGVTAPTPRLTITPRRPRRGGSIVVTARAFAPHGKIVATVTRARQRFVTAASPATAAGAARLRLRIPGSARPGAYLVTACQGGCESIASGRIFVRR